MEVEISALTWTKLFRVLRVGGWKKIRRVRFLSSITYVCVCVYI